MKQMIVLTLCLVAIAPVSVGAVELCSALDGSGSISDDEFAYQLEGLALAVENPAILPDNGTITLSVVVFGAYSVTAIPAKVIDGPATAEGLASDIRGIVPPPGSDFWHRTDIKKAIEACMDQFIQFGDPADEWVIDVSTDGAQNQTTLVALYAARDDAAALGLDTLNALAVGTFDPESLEGLVWPQPATSPPERGFVIQVPDFETYVTAMQEKVQTEVGVTFALDIKPRSCPNPLNTGENGVLPVAVVGGGDLDVYSIDPSTILLEGVEPLRWNYEDVTAPFDPAVPRESCLDCSTDGPDGTMDLTAKFDARQVVAALGDPNDGQCLILTLTGTLKPEYDSRAFSGSDVVRILEK